MDLIRVFSVIRPKKIEKFFSLLHSSNKLTMYVTVRRLRKPSDGKT